MSRKSAAIRIIGGIWNGRKISFPVSRFRPSGGRVRESLFNCLGQYLEEAHCLDLFAGSGALGLSAISWGAKHVIMIEKQKEFTHSLFSLVEKWNAPVTVIQISAQSFLKNNDNLFNIVFLDPPFSDYRHDEEWEKLLTSIRPHLKEGARVYCESNRFFSVPENWIVWRFRRVGSVYWQIIMPISV